MLNFNLILNVIVIPLYVVLVDKTQIFSAESCWMKKDLHTWLYLFVYLRQNINIHQLPVKLKTILFRDFKSMFV